MGFYGVKRTAGGRDREGIPGQREVSDPALTLTVEARKESAMSCQAVPSTVGVCEVLQPDLCDSFGDGGCEGDRLTPHWQGWRLGGKFAHIKLSQFRCNKSHSDILDRHKPSGSLGVSQGPVEGRGYLSWPAGMDTGSLENDLARSVQHRQPGIWISPGLL